MVNYARAFSQSESGMNNNNWLGLRLGIDIHISMYFKKCYCNIVKVKCTVIFYKSHRDQIKFSILLAHPSIHPPIHPSFIHPIPFSSISNSHPFRCWGFLSSCAVAVNCGPLNAPVDGTIIERVAYTFGHRIVFECKSPGYEMKGSKIRTCQSDGQWSGSLTKCESKYFITTGRAKYNPE